MLIYRAPILIGEGKSALGYVGLDSIAAAHRRWMLTDTRPLGIDRLEVYERVRASSGKVGTGFPPGRCSNRDSDVYRDRSEEHTSELQSLMRISYAVFCLTKNKYTNLQKPAAFLPNYS